MLGYSFQSKIHPNPWVVFFFSPQQCWINTSEVSRLLLILLLQDSQRIKKLRECQELEEPSGDYLVQPRCQSRVTQSTLHRTVSRALTESRDGDSTAVLGIPLQFSTAFNKFHPVCHWMTKQHNRASVSSAEMSCGVKGVFQGHLC